jgi:hypothetical protein
MTDSNARRSFVPLSFAKCAECSKDNSPPSRRRAKYSRPNARDFYPIAAFLYKSIDFLRVNAEIALWRVNCTNKWWLRLNSLSALVLTRV